jgi:hypothetical protein
MIKFFILKREMAGKKRLKKRTIHIRKGSM